MHLPTLKVGLAASSPLTHSPIHSHLSLKHRMEMPDSPPSSTTTPKTTWALPTTLPVSYRVALAIEIFVLVITLLSLSLLAIYVRNQYRRRKLHQAIEEQEGLKMEEGEERRVGRKGRKGHVRWSSGVQGGSVDLSAEVKRGRGRSSSLNFDPDQDGYRVGPLERVGSRSRERERGWKVSERLRAGYEGFRGN